MDLAQVVAFGLAEAKWLGGTLLAAGVAIRLVGRAISRTLLFAGLLATAALAYQEWQGLHSIWVAAGILLGGATIVGVLAWTIRGLSFLFAFVLIATAFYLLAYGWLGPTYVATANGALTWAGATIVTMILTGLHTGLAHKLPVAAVGAGLFR